MKKRTTKFALITAALIAVLAVCALLGGCSAKMHAVTVKYVSDATGSAISEDYVLLGAWGDEYDVTRMANRVPDGYLVSNIDGETSGKFTFRPKTVTVLCTEKKDVTVKINYILKQTGAQLEPPYVHGGKTGDAYDLSAYADVDNPDYAVAEIRGELVGTVDRNKNIIVYLEPYYALSYEEYSAEQNSGSEFTDISGTYAEGYEKRMNEDGSYCLVRSADMKVIVPYNVSCWARVGKRLICCATETFAKSKRVDHILIAVNLDGSGLSVVERVVQKQYTYLRAGVKYTGQLGINTSAGIFANKYCVIYAAHDGIYRIFLPAGQKDCLSKVPFALKDYGIYSILPLSVTDVAYAAGRDDYTKWLFASEQPTSYEQYSEFAYLSDIAAFDYYVCSSSTGVSVQIGSSPENWRSQLDDAEFAATVGGYKPPFVGAYFENLVAEYRAAKSE